MRIFIPSMRRSHIQYTVESIQKESPFFITVVVPFEEWDTYESYRKAKRWSEKVDVISPPPDLPQGIGPTRQWILHEASKDETDNKFIAMDDDLTFAVRRGDEPEKFREPQSGEIREMLVTLSELLDTYAHVSVATREGANRNTEELIHCVRAMRVTGFRRDIAIACGVDHRESTVMEDFEVTLKLLTSGYENAILNTFVQNQKGSNTAGGASVYRTTELQDAAARKLQARYPDFVKLVRKKTKTAWNGQERTDVIVQWKKAYAYGRAKREQVSSSGQ